MRGRRLMVKLLGYVSYEWVGGRNAFDVADGGDGDGVWMEGSGEQV